MLVFEYKKSHFSCEDESRIHEGVKKIASENTVCSLARHLASSHICYFIIVFPFLSGASIVCLHHPFRAPAMIS